MPIKRDNNEATTAHSVAEAGHAEKLATRIFQRRWSIVAGVCLLIAGACLFVARMEAAFVAATLGVVAWFWNERNRLRPTSIEADDEFQDEDEEIDDRVEK